MKKAIVSIVLLVAFSSSFSQTFTLNGTSFKVGSYYRSYNVLFDLGNATLRPECFPNLDSVINFLNNNSSIKLEIGVHSDFRGSIPANNNLTMSRAVSIMDYFVSKGIDSKRLKAVGYGETKPLISEEEIKKSGDSYVNKNRRVEFKITAI